ncbi:MAG: hypothetical protein ACOYYJ_12695 [Chloroflexota bacterium]
MKIFPIWKRFPGLATPLALLLVAVFSYGIFALQQGFYWDDWAFAWTRVNLGPEGIIQLFSVTRPMRGGMEAFLTMLLGAHPAVWQAYAVSLHWLAAVACWWFLQVLWPSRRWQASLAALFFLVYPGFTQQPLAMTYHYYWTFTTLFFLSLGLMVQAVRPGRWKWLKLGGAVGLGGLALWAMEYLFGLELLRIAMLWIALGPVLLDAKSRLKQTALHYFPFFVVLGIYLYWRFFVYQDTRYSLDAVGHGGAASLFSLPALAWETLKTLPVAGLGAWLKILQQDFLAQDISLVVAFLYGLVLLGGAFGLSCYFKSFQHDPSAPAPGWWEPAGLAALLLVFAGLPFIIVGLPIRLSFPEDRYTLPFALGVSLLLAALLDLIKDAPRRFTLAALLVPLAMTVQIHNTDVYRKEWQSQRAFLWQLAWRAPHIQPGTTFLAEDGAVFPHNDDEAFAFLVNWAYAPDSGTAQLPYEYFWVSARLGYQLPGLQKGLPISMDHFAATFSGTTDRVLVARFSPPSCLRILDPLYDADAPLLPRDVDAPYADSEIAWFALPRNTARALPLSAPAALVSDGDPPPVPEWLFGAEPEHRWCYYFQKADLARQGGNWQKVAKLGDQAFKVPYYPDDPAEYLPFIEAYGRLGRFDDAQALTEKAADLNPALRPMLCAAWQRVASLGTTSPAELGMLQSLLQSLKCSP